MSNLHYRLKENVKQNMRRDLDINCPDWEDYENAMINVLKQYPELAHNVIEVYNVASGKKKKPSQKKPPMSFEKAVGISYSALLLDEILSKMDKKLCEYLKKEFVGLIDFSHKLRKSTKGNVK